MKKRYYLPPLIIVIALIGGFIVYTSNPYTLSEEASQYLISSESVTVSQESYGLSFIPNTLTSDIGIVLYPGGLVEYDAYSPLMYHLAEKGYQTYIVQMPFNLAVFNSSAFEEVQKNNPDIKHWYIGGHSLGGVMAASYFQDNIESFDGLFFLASYTSKDLSTCDTSIISLYGSLDGVLNMASYNDALSKLPSNAKEYVIEGGNHGNFGSYGIQTGDNLATITWQDQQAITVEQIDFWIKNNSK